MERGQLLKPFLLVLLLLTFGSGSRAFAQEQGAKSLPDSLQKMLTTVQQKQSLAVAVVQTDVSADARPDSGYLEIQPAE